MNNLKIIDAHGHLGDILYPGGGELVFKTGIKFPDSFLEWFLCERTLYRETFWFRAAEKISPMWSVLAERKRNAAATLENLQKSLEGTDIVRCVCAPVAPNCTYAHMLSAAKAEPRIIAFGSPDFSGGAIAMQKKLESDLGAGAAGIKIHPILQEVPADSELVFAAAETIAPYSRPILLHSGPARYYLKKEKRAHSLHFASIDKIERLVAAFPLVNFIVGHAGLDDYKTTAALLPKYKNAYVDTSFQSPESISELIAAFGCGRVLFGSDWHYGKRLPMIKTAQAACGSDAGLEQAIFYDNAAEVFGL